ncbi:unnamed protein product [Protopolystoma xenopodis]|uniref:Uncharacterized protein n=1 Tax=Protopolystoma xenopodis TaxID=117903 RepID=A0A448X8Y5_9PLAT|nr:unnamed protein product [Protopolystoma xenopodis]
MYKQESANSPRPLTATGSRNRASEPRECRKQGRQTKPKGRLIKDSLAVTYTPMVYDSFDRTLAMPISKAGNKLATMAWTRISA